MNLTYPLQLIPASSAQIKLTAFNIYWLNQFNIRLDGFLKSE